MSSEFKKGDAVYYSGREIGIISDVYSKGYRVNCCQGKDLKTGPRGGNVPVTQEGYPKRVTEPADVLFVAALSAQQRLRFLEQQLAFAVGDYDALVRARRVLIEAEDNDE